MRLEQQDGVRQLTLDYGECIGCGACIDAAAEAFGAATRTYSLRRESERRSSATGMSSGFSELFADDAAAEDAATAIRTLLGRALNIRQVDAGSCNGCEAEIAALTNPYYDLERFGIHFVASPKHADMLLVTGPVTRNMAEALKPKL